LEPFLAKGPLSTAGKTVLKQFPTFFPSSDSSSSPSFLFYRVSHAEEITKLRKNDGIVVASWKVAEKISPFE
jgi:hypothetical protein